MAEIDEKQAAIDALTGASREHRRADVVGFALVASMLIIIGIVIGYLLGRSI